MDESVLQERLYRIEQRQYLILILLVIPYLIALTEVVGFWIAIVLGTAFGLVAFAVVVIHRRRSRGAAGR